MTGEVTEIRPPSDSRQPTLLVISPAGQTPPVVVGYTSDLQPVIEGAYGPPPKGTQISAKGKLFDWQGMYVIRVKSADAIRISPPTAAAAVQSAPAASVPTAGSVAPDANSSNLPKPDALGYFTPADVVRTAEFVDQELAVRGTVSAFRASWGPKAPNLLTLSSEGENLEVVFWPNNGAYSPDMTNVGNQVYAVGLLQKYKGRLQLRVDENKTISGAPLAPELIKLPKGVVVSAAPVQTPVIAPAPGAPVVPTSANTLFAGLPDALAMAKTQNKNVLVLFTSSTVPSSVVIRKAMEETNDFKGLSNIVLALVDGSQDQGTLRKYEVLQVPAVLVVDGDGKVIERSATVKPEEILALAKAH